MASLRLFFCHQHHQDFGERKNVAYACNKKVEFASQLTLYDTAKLANQNFLSFIFLKFRPSESDPNPISIYMIG